MTSQLRIDGSEQHLDGLTPRQRLALEYVAQHQPVSSDELGARLHQDRHARGGRGHDCEARCDWCQSEGQQMLRRLREHGLVIMKRRVGWMLAGATVTPSRPDRGLQGDLPEGF